MHVDHHRHLSLANTLTTTRITAMVHHHTTTEVAVATAVEGVDQEADHGAAATILPPADCPTALQHSCKT